MDNKINIKKSVRKKEAVAAFSRLIDIIDTLRSPGGCPWDIKQTSQSLKPYFIEETYEVIDAIDANQPDHVKEELGDVLLQIMLHSQIAFEEDNYHVGDVIEGLSQKMIERHPHVFSTTQVSGEAEVLQNWEKIKAKKNSDRGLLDGVPSALPGLLKAFRMGQKAGRVGFDWPETSMVREKVTEELGELDEAVQSGDTSAMSHELGDVLFAVAQWGRHLGIEPEEAMRQSCQRFSSRFAYVEKAVDDAGEEMPSCGLETLEQYWQEAKKNEAL